MIWSFLYGVLGAGFLCGSLAARDHRGVGYGVLMLSSWLVSFIAVTLMPAAWAPAAFAPFDAMLGLIVAVTLKIEPEERGAALLAMFAIEMMVHGAAAAFGQTGNVNYYFALNVIYVTQVVISGAPGGIEAVRHYWSRRDHRSVAHRNGG